MFRGFVLSRFTFIVPAAACLLAACGGSDTIFDDAGGGSGTSGAAGAGGNAKDGSGGGVLADTSVADTALLDQSLGDVALGSDSLPDVPTVDVKLDTAPLDARLDVDAGVNLDATLDVDATVSLDAAVDGDAAINLDATVDGDAAINLDATVDAGVFSILGSAGTFAVLGGQTVTNTGATIIFGNLGVSPLTALGGTPATVLGTTHLNDLTAQNAQSDLTVAYNTLAGRVCGTALTGQDLGGLTLTPGVYCFTSGAQLTGTLFLNGQGRADAVWIFQVASTLVTANNAQITMTNSGNACNVYWQVGSSATIGGQTLFSGNVLALADITVQNAATVTGRMLSRAAGSVTLASNTVSIATCPGAPLIDASIPDAEAGVVDAGVGDVTAN